MAESIKFGETTVRMPHPAPAKFDPLAASDRELLLHGFPRRPDEKRFPELHAHWKRVLARPFQYVAPTFKPHPEIQHSRHRPIKVKDDIYSENWAGSIAFLGSFTDRFTWVSGAFTVPHPFPPTGAPDGTAYHHSTWIGIGGWTTDPGGLVQVGVHQQLVAKKGFPDNVNYYMWWDWVPGYEIEIAFYVVPGDTIHAIICTESPNDALVFLLNENSLQGTSFFLHSDQPGAALVGQSAEWIVEAPLVNGEIAQLTRFHEITFEETHASATNESLSTAYGGTMIDMADANGTRFAWAVPDGDTVRVTSRD